jgi:outer membrane protein OmpA-like peptidoglycan-associated protein
LATKEKETNQLEMHKFSRILILLFIRLIVLPSTANAQIWVDNESIYEEAEGYLLGEEYEEALPLYQLLEKKGISNANISYKQGLCYLNIPGRESKSVPFFEGAIENISSHHSGTLSDYTAPLDALLKLGQAYQMINDLEKSKTAFYTYKDSVKGTEKEQLADYYLAQIEMAEILIEEASGHTLKMLNDYSNYSVYNPVVFADSLVYHMEARPFYNAVIQANISNEQAIEKENLTPFIGSNDPIKLVSMSYDGNMLIFTAPTNENGYELFYSTLKDNGKWSGYKAFKSPVNTPSGEQFASLSANGKIMYLSSNRPGGYGGYDIYKSELQSDGKWGIPENLGKTVNSPFNEIVCYISPDGKILVLSSEGHRNIGGYDLFYAKSTNNDDWHSPVNFGVPVSTTADDNYLSISPEGDFFTSRFDEKGSGRQRIYKLVLDDNSLKQKVLVRNQLYFTEELPPKEVTYLITELEQNEVVVRSVTDKDGQAKNLLPNGSYLYEFVYSNDARAKQKIVITDDIVSDELTLDGPEWELVRAENPRRIILIKDVLFDFNSSLLKSEYISMLDSIGKLLVNENDLRISLEGHTDALGSSSYNKVLAQKRAETVRLYLTNTGIDISKISLISKGEEDPVAINQNTDGSDNASGRKFNRRVSILIETSNEEIVIRKIVLVPSDLTYQK